MVFGRLSVGEICMSLSDVLCVESLPVVLREVKLKSGDFLDARVVGAVTMCVFVDPKSKFGVELEARLVGRRGCDIWELCDIEETLVVGVEIF